MPESTISATLYFSADQQTLECAGNWTIAYISELESQWLSIMNELQKTVIVDVSKIVFADSTGALFFRNVINSLKSEGRSVTVAGAQESFQSLLDLVSTDIPSDIPSVKGDPNNPLYWLGKWANLKWNAAIQLLNFLGEGFVRLFYSISPSQYSRWPLVLRVINEAGIGGLPIVGLLTFLVGVILTYQIAIQLSGYNMNVIIVDITGVSVLREFGPLITAIIAAGRTSTAFTAEIGTMKVNEEIDALETMGISPTEQLVLPKIIGALIALPLLTLWADAFGIFGTMVMSDYEMGVSFRLYLDRFQEVISVQDFIVGIVKAPVFALIIAAVGCFHGFSAARTAESVGQKTMQSAVQSIFLIIIADALFSIIFGWQHF